MFQYLHAEKQSKNHQKCRGKRVSGRGSATALETRLLSKIKTITQMHPGVKRWKDLCLELAFLRMRARRSTTEPQCQVR